MRKRIKPGMTGHTKISFLLLNEKRTPWSLTRGGGNTCTTSHSLKPRVRNYNILHGLRFWGGKAAQHNHKNLFKYGLSIYSVYHDWAAGNVSLGRAGVWWPSEHGQRLWGEIRDFMQRFGPRVALYEMMKEKFCTFYSGRAVTSNPSLFPSEQGFMSRCLV